MHEWFAQTFDEQIIHNRGLYILIPAIFLFEWLNPANPRQKIFSRALLNDFFYFCVEWIQLGLALGYVFFLTGIYERHLSWMTIRSIESLPYPIHFVWGFLVSDFLGWFHHWIRHKVPCLWDFHRVHHAQREMNIFTDQRAHIMEYMVARTVSVFPMLIFAVHPPTIVAFTLFHHWYTKLCHANVRTHLGPLKYVLITPQAHRVHHSMEERHFDKNFGIFLCIWDRMFGTFHENCEEYPETGLPEAEFPPEVAAYRKGVFALAALQFWYPFVCVWERAKKRITPCSAAPEGRPRFEKPESAMG